MLGLRVERGENPYPVHLFIPRPGIGDAEVELCLSFAEAKNLNRTLSSLLEEIRMDNE